MKIAQSEIKELAQLVAKLTYLCLKKDGVDQATALSAAKDAADAYANGLELDLREHGVLIDPDLTRKIAI